MSEFSVTTATGDVRQQFNVTCSKEVNSTTGLISATMHWSIEPNLPFKLEALKFLKVNIHEATWEKSQNLSIGELNSLSSAEVKALVRRGDLKLKVPKSEANISKVGEVRSTTTTIAMDENVAGFMTLEGVTPKISPNILHFEVYRGCYSN